MTTTGDSATAEAWVTGTPNGTEFCGDWFNDARSMQVLSNADCSGYTNSGPLSILLLHEVGHAVGWTAPSVHKSIFGTSAADHCVMHLPSDGSLNTQICAHEIEGALAAYGLVSYNVNTFFSTPFVVGTANALAAQNLLVGDTVYLSPGNWQLEGENGFVPGSSGNYNWSTTASAVATVSGGAVIAVSPGTATIRATPASSSSYLFSHPFRTTGRAATVTVSSPPPPPPPPPGIYLDQVPVWTPGYHTLTYVASGGSSSTSWSIDDSRTTSINPDTTFSTPGRTATIYIDAGSYTLTVKVGSRTQDFPVCTTGAALVDSETLGGDDETSAVENCPPPDDDPPEYE